MIDILIYLVVSSILAHTVSQNEHTLGIRNFFVSVVLTYNTLDQIMLSITALSFAFLHNNFQFPLHFRLDVMYIIPHVKVLMQSLHKISRCS